MFLAGRRWVSGFRGRCVGDGGGKGKERKGAGGNKGVQACGLVAGRVVGGGDLRGIRVGFVSLVNSFNVTVYVWGGRLKEFM